MRIAIAAAVLAASTTFAAADFFVVQNTQTRQCSIEEDMPTAASSEILLKNRFMERADAEAAMKEVPACR